MSSWRNDAAIARRAKRDASAANPTMEADMVTTRREVLAGLVSSVAGAGLLSPAAGITVAATAPGQPPRFFSARQMSLLARLSELLIPRTETPGALDVNVPGFIDGLMVDWASSETAKQYRAHLEELAGSLSGDGGGDFLSLDAKRQAQGLARLDQLSLAGQPGGSAGWVAFKSLVTRSYFATERGALEELQWPAVPGQWIPCRPLEAAAGEGAA
jgi:hypothetical protein